MSERSSGVRGVLESVGLVDSSPVSQTPRRNLVRWFLLAGCLTAMVIILAGRAPQQFAMPVLFPLGVGAGFGLALGELSRILLINRLRLTRMAAAVAVLVTLLAVTWQWYRLYETKTLAWQRENPLKVDPLSGELRTALNNVPENETPTERKTRLEMRASVEESAARHARETLRREESLSVAGYLRERWANFGPLNDLSPPWPGLLWCSELALAALLAVVLHGGPVRLPEPEETRAAGGTP